jgi:hypothetical protein
VSALQLRNETKSQNVGGKCLLAHVGGPSGSAEVRTQALYKRGEVHAGSTREPPISL